MRPCKSIYEWLERIAKDLRCEKAGQNAGEKDSDREYRPPISLPGRAVARRLGGEVDNVGCAVCDICQDCQHEDQLRCVDGYLTERCWPSHQEEGNDNGCENGVIRDTP